MRELTPAAGTFAERMATNGTPLPEYVQREFEDYLRRGRLKRMKRGRYPFLKKIKG